jgi:hypothetical protein
VRRIRWLSGAQSCACEVGKSVDTSRYAPSVEEILSEDSLIVPSVWNRGCYFPIDLSSSLVELLLSNWYTSSRKLDGMAQLFELIIPSLQYTSPVQQLHIFLEFVCDSCFACWYPGMLLWATICRQSPLFPHLLLGCKLQSIRGKPAASSLVRTGVDFLVFPASVESNWGCWSKQSTACGRNSRCLTVEWTISTLIGTVIEGCSATVASQNTHFLL